MLKSQKIVHELEMDSLRLRLQDGKHAKTLELPQDFCGRTYRRRESKEAFNLEMVSLVCMPSIIRKSFCTRSTKIFVSDL